MKGLRNILDVLFVIGLALFMGLGTIIVLVQLVGVFSANGALTVNIMQKLGNPTFLIAAITGIIGFIQSYLYGWKTGD